MNDLQWFAIFLGMVGSILTVLIWISSCVVAGRVDRAMAERIENEMNERWGLEEAEKEREMAR